MKLSTTLSVLALATVAAASDVVVLTADNFKKEVTQAGQLVLTEFYAPWCGHCKNLAPHYEEAATELKKHNIKLAKVDCTEHADLCQQYGVQGYPTLKIFDGAAAADYEGPRKADGIISYMIKSTLPSVSEVIGANFTEFKGSDKVVVISFTPTGDAPEAFAEFADGQRNSYLLGHTNDPEAFKLAGLPADKPTVVIYKTFDEVPNVLSAAEYDSMTADSLAAWVKPNAVPVMDEISPENFATYAEAGIPLAYLFVDPEKTKENEALIKAIKTVANGYKDKFAFVWIDGVKFIDHGKSLNVKTDAYPGFVIQDLAAQTKYPLKAATVDAAEVEKFLKTFIAGTLSPDVKSAAIPAKNDEGVYVLVADEYKKVVWEQGADKDVFIEFYAPWCGHCKKLAPIYDTLGEKYADVDTVTIAKFDATENDVPPSEPFKVEGFPTLKFRPAYSDKYIDYNGDRSLESLIEFIEENAVHDIVHKNAAASNETKEAPATPKEAPAVTPVTEEKKVEAPRDEL